MASVPVVSCGDESPACHGCPEGRCRECGWTGAERGVLSKDQKTKEKTKKPRQRYEIGQWGVMLKEYLPPGLKSLCVDLFFRYMPVSFICLLWKELDGYFRIRRPKEGDVVVDAGAWTGHFTLVAARLVGRR